MPSETITLRTIWLLTVALRRLRMSVVTGPTPGPKATPLNKTATPQRHRRRARGGAPLIAKISRRRDAERAVAVVLQRRQRVIDEHRRALPAHERAGERRQQRAWIDVRVHLQLM